MSDRFPPGQMDLFGASASLPGAGAPGLPSPPSPQPPRPLTPGQLLVELRRRGAPALMSVRLRRNRTVLWSLTERGSVLNLHAAFAGAPDPVLDDLARIARHGARGAVAREAAGRVRDWPPVGEAMEKLRGVQVVAALAAAEGVPGAEEQTAGVRCTGSDDERRRVRGLYLAFNAERFEGILPEGLPIRLSDRMKSRLGHVKPATTPGGVRVVVEIALNRLLLHPSNGLLLEDVLLHEMAHAADWLVDGRAGHGPTWKAWARRVGCHPMACTPMVVRGGKGNGRRSNRGQRRG